MSERVMPTEPGLWFVRWRGTRRIVDVIRSGDRSFVVSEDYWRDVDNTEFEWLRPVPTAEAIDAAVAAMDSAETLLSNLGGCPAEIADVSRVLGLLQNAIAALAGKGE